MYLENCIVKVKIAEKKVYIKSKKKQKGNKISDCCNFKGLMRKENSCNRKIV